MPSLARISFAGDVPSTVAKISPLAAFRGGLNPYSCDHVELEERFAARHIDGAFLLQVFHIVLSNPQIDGVSSMPCNQRPQCFRVAVADFPGA